MLECWAERAQRPTFARLMVMLKNLLQSYLLAEPGDSDDEGVLVTEPFNVNEAHSNRAETHISTRLDLAVPTSNARQLADSNYGESSASATGNPFTELPRRSFPRPVTYATTPRIYSPPAIYGRQLALVQ
jgi:hypothetical protein